EGVFGQPAAEDLIEARHAGAQLANPDPGSSLIRPWIVLFSARAHEALLQSETSNDASGQDSRTRRSVSGSPMKVTSSPSKWAVSEPSASTPPSGSSAASSSSPSIEQSRLTVMRLSEGTSTRA